MATDQRQGPGIRREAQDLREGDVVQHCEVYADYGVVTRVDPTWVHFAIAGLEVRARSLGEVQVVDVDDVLGVDSAYATHLYDRDAGEVRVMQRSEDGTEYYLDSTQDVPRDQLGAYLVWVVDQGREWLPGSMPGHVCEVYEAAGGGQP